MDTFFNVITLDQAMHNGENDSHKRQFLALGVHSQSWKSNNLLKENSFCIGCRWIPSNAGRQN